MSPKVIVVITVCILAALVTIEVVFWIFSVPAGIQAWILGVGGGAVALYLLLMLILQKIRR